MASSVHQNNGSSTYVLELQPQQPSKATGSKLSLPESIRSIGHRLSEHNQAEEDRNERLPSPITASEVLQKWNDPPINKYRCFATFWSFVIMGGNDAAYGAIIPYLETYYHLTYTVVSLVFFSPVVGYVAAGLLNNKIHMKFGQRGIAILGPLCHLLAYVIIAAHPPYPALVVVFIIAGFGNGLEDSGWNAWIGAMAQANEVLGFLHGFYGLGATLSPLIATTLITKAGWSWYSFYHLMIGAAVIELATSVWAFRGATGAAHRASVAGHGAETKGTGWKESLFQKPGARVVWLIAGFLLFYVGVEVALGGWVVVFMMRVRHGNAFASGMTATGFWLGITIGRVVLGFITPLIGEKLAISIYLPIAMGLEILFWLVPQFYVSAVAIGLIGFFLAPLFPAAIVAATKLLPKRLHVSAIGIAAALGGGGAAIFPFAVGAIAQAKGVQVLQPIALAIMVIMLGFWLGLPRFNKKLE